MRNLFLLYVFAWSFYFAGCTGQSDGVAPSNDLTSVSDAPIITSPSSNPYYSNSGTLNLSGTCYGDATVALNGDSAQTVTCSGSTFTFAVNKTSDGTYNFTVYQYGTDGVFSPSTSTFVWNLDTVAPTTPTRTSPSTSPYTSGDSNITISGACETGATVNITGALTSSVVCSSSAYSFNESKSSDGTYNYSITQTDLAGNVSSVRSFTWVRDGSIPATPVITTPVSATHYSNVTNLTISGTCTSGLTVTIGGDLAASNVITPASSLTQTCTGGGTFSYIVQKSTDASYNFTVKQTSLSAIDSNVDTLNWVRDTVPPAAPIITTPAVSPFTSGDDNLTISGTCEANATVNISGDLTSSMTCTVGGTFSFSDTKTSNGTYNYSVNQVDRASNTSSSDTQIWSRDNSIPATPVITTPSVSPYYSNDNTVIISGTCTATYTVTLSGDVVAGDVVTPASSLTQTCTGGGTFSFEVQKLTDSNYNLSVYQTSPSLVDSSSDSQVWTRDTVTPADPVIVNPSSSPYTAPSPLSVTGTCETNATVYLTGDDTQSTTCVDSAFSFSITESVDGTYNYSVSQTDVAGNNSAGSDSQSWNCDSSSLPPVVISTPTIINYISNANSVTIAGSCTSGASVHISGDLTNTDVSTPTNSLATSCTLSSFTFVVNKSVDNTYNFVLNQTLDALSSSNVSQSWMRDTVAPATTINSNPNNPNLSISSVFTFSSDDPSATFECKLDSDSYAACTSPYQNDTISNGSHTFYVRAKDAANNYDASPATYSWTQGAYNTAALYHFTTGSVLTDSSLYTAAENNVLTASGATSTASGTFGHGLLFTAASSHYAYKSDNLSQDTVTSIMTLEAFVKFNALPGTNGHYQLIASKHGASGNFGWQFGVKKQGANYRLTFIGSLNGTSTTQVDSGNCSIGTTNFHHVAVTWNKGSLKFFCDGTAMGTGTIGTAGSSVLYSSTADLRFGRTESMTGNAKYLDGILDEVRISQVIRWSSSFSVPTGNYTAD